MGTRTTVARTSFYLVKAFSVRSAFLLDIPLFVIRIVLFVVPIGLIFSSTKLVGHKPNTMLLLVEWWYLVQCLVRYSVDFSEINLEQEELLWLASSLALANASLAMLEPLWTNTTVMTIFLIAQAFIAGIALICIISLSMRLTWSKVGGTQFTAYMSLFNLSGVTAYLLTERMIEIFDYSSAIYVGAALTMISAIMLIFIDEDETDRVLEGRLGDGRRG